MFVADNEHTTLEATKALSAAAVAMLPWVAFPEAAEVVGASATKRVLMLELADFVCWCLRG